MKDAKGLDSSPHGADASDSLDLYRDYNRVLRTWFVAFGIGGPALLLVNSDVAKALASHHELRRVSLLFLIGVVLQVSCALLNKTVNWYVYASSVADQTTENCCGRVAEWLSRRYCIDLLVDLGTIVVFGWGAWIVLTVFAVGG
jgi:hypothetical protein